MVLSFETFEANAFKYDGLIKSTTQQYVTSDHGAEGRPVKDAIRHLYVESMQCPKHTYSSVEFFCRTRSKYQLHKF